MDTSEPDRSLKSWVVFHKEKAKIHEVTFAIHINATNHIDGETYPMAPTLCAPTMWLMKFACWTRFLKVLEFEDHTC